MCAKFLVVEPSCEIVGQPIKKFVTLVTPKALSPCLPGVIVGQNSEHPQVRSPMLHIATDVIFSHLLPSTKPEGSDFATSPQALIQYRFVRIYPSFNPLNTELNPICQ